MNEAAIINWIELHTDLIGITAQDGKNFQGSLKGVPIYIKITKNPRLGYAVEAKSKDKRVYSLGNHDHNLEVALSIVNWSQLERELFG